MAKQLEERSLTELRAMASAMGVSVSFADDKGKLLKAIRAEVAAKAPKPLPFAPLVPSDPLNQGSWQGSVKEALQHMIDRGLILSFPTSDQWHMQRDQKSDSGTMKMPLRGIVRCAEAVMK